MPATSPFRGATKHLLVVGNQQAGSWWLAPVTPNQLFTPRKGQLASYQDHISPTAPQPASPQEPFTAYAAAPDQEFFPLVPICGRHLCEQLFQGMYPADAANMWSYFQLAQFLDKELVAHVTHEDTKARLKQSILGLVTVKGRNQAGTVTLRKITRPPAAVTTWALDVIPKILEPSPGPNAGSTSPQGTNPATGSTSSPGTNPATGSTSPPGTNPATGSTSPEGTNPATGSTSPPGTNPASGSTSPPGTNPATGSARQSATGSTSHPGTSPTPGSTGQPTPGSTSHSTPTGELIDPSEALPGQRRVHFGELGPELSQSPAKQPRLETPTAGLESLNDTNLHALMGYTRATTPQQIPQIWQELLLQPKTDRANWFCVHVTGPLAKQELNREAFSKFEYLPQLVNTLADLSFVHSTRNAVYWDTMVGHQLRRSKDEVRGYNNLLSAQTAQNVTLTVRPDQVHKLHSSEPPPITQITELQHFLKRVIAFTGLFFPQSTTGGLARAYHDAILSHTTQLSSDPTWMSNKPKEIIFQLVESERREFQHHLTAQDFADGMDPPFLTRYDIDHIASSCLSATPSVAANLMPPGLRPSVTQLPLPVPQAPLPVGASPSTQTGRGRGQHANRGAARQQQPQQNQETGPRTHPSHPRALADFWNSVPPNRASQGIKPWLQAAHSSPAACLGLLGLANSDCALFHIRGHCNNSRCLRRHTPKTLPTAGVDTVAGLLRQGLDQTS